MNNEPKHSEREAMYNESGLGWMRHVTSKGKMIQFMSLQEIAEYVIELEASRASKPEGVDVDFILVDQEFLDNWYAGAIENRPDVNIYKEGLIAAYEDLSARIGTPREKRIDSTALKIRMRNAEPKALAHPAPQDVVKKYKCAACRDTGKIQWTDYSNGQGLDIACEDDCDKCPIPASNRGW